MSKLTQNRSVNRSTISRAVKEHLGMKLYVRRVRKLLFNRLQSPQSWKMLKAFEPPLMVPKDIWPSNSPDLNICDSWLFGVIGRESYLLSILSVNSLKVAINLAFRSLVPEDVKRSCSRFRSRFSQIFDAMGSHMEWFCSVAKNEQKIQVKITFNHYLLFKIANFKKLC